MVLEKTLEIPLDSKEIQPVHPKGNQSWIFLGRTDSEAETPIVWPAVATNWLIWKDWRREEKGTKEMIKWHHWLNAHEFEYAPGVGDRQGGLVCCSSWGHKESGTTEWLNWFLGFFFFKFKIFIPNISLCLLYPCLRKRHLELLYFFDYCSCNWNAPLPTFSEGSP